MWGSPSADEVPTAIPALAVVCPERAWPPRLMMQAATAPFAGLAVQQVRRHPSQQQAQKRQVLLLARESQPWDQQARRHPSRRQARTRQLLLARESQPWAQQVRRHPSQRQARRRQWLLAGEDQPWAQQARRHSSQRQARTRQLLTSVQCGPPKAKTNLFDSRAVSAQGSPSGLK